MRISNETATSTYLSHGDVLSRFNFPISKHLHVIHVGFEQVKRSAIKESSAVDMLIANRGYEWLVAGY